MSDQGTARRVPAPSQISRSFATPLMLQKNMFERLERRLVHRSFRFFSLATLEGVSKLTSLERRVCSHTIQYRVRFTSTCRFPRRGLKQSFHFQLLLM